MNPPLQGWGLHPWSENQDPECCEVHPKQNVTLVTVKEEGRVETVNQLDGCRNSVTDGFRIIVLVIPAFTKCLLCFWDWSSFILGDPQKRPLTYKLPSYITGLKTKDFNL